MADWSIAVGIVGGVVGLVSPVVGWGILLYQNGKNMGSVDTQVKADISNIKNDQTEIKEDIATINKTLGNGGYAGIKGTLHEIEVECAKKTTGFETRIKQLEAHRREDERG